jgi:putative ABC transport system substrate-binding protein
VNRRAFIALLGAASGWPAAAAGQPSSSKRRVGVLMGYPEYDREALDRVAILRKTLHERGWIAPDYIELNVKLPGADDRALHSAAEQLLAWKPDVIVSSPGQVVLVLSRLTSTIPVVFANLPDPVGLGLIQGLARPGGNITGFTSIETGLAGKWIEVLRECSPMLDTVAAIYNPSNPAWAPRLKLMQDLGPRLGVKVVGISIAEPGQIEKLGGVTLRPNLGLVVLPSVFATTYRTQLIAAAISNRLPAIYPYRFFAEAGGLMSYGINIPNQFRGAAQYVDRILRGEKAGELPVQAPDKFELVINLKTAKALGLDIPPTLLARADEVIE